MTSVFHNRLLGERNEEGVWRGLLSSSAVATAVACCALRLAGRSETLVEKMQSFLWTTQLADGTWGDSPESPGNPTATLLARIALDLERGDAPAALVQKVREIYGRDLTFAAPILALCAAMKIIPWDCVPRLPYRLALLPRCVFHFLRLPVVSYAIPALIAVGLATREKREGREKYLRLLAAMQPSDGGYLAAAPLTGFVASCLIAAGHGDSHITHQALDFLEASIREDGGVPIDSNLEIWLTSLAIKSLGGAAFTPTERQNLIAWYLRHQRKEIHPFNGATPGGWAWTTLDGGVPDADDTAAALIALRTLDAPYSPEIEKALRWLMSLQNSDGGIATFCRGWGYLPFDRSAPDISAHAHRALALWRTDAPFSSAINSSLHRIENYLEKSQAADGSWTPLWFGDQDAPDLVAPVYGTAVVLEHLTLTRKKFLRKASDFLLNAQNADGGWGGAVNTPSKILMTSRVITALTRSASSPKAIAHAKTWLAQTPPRPEPIGLYFAKLWYSERLYPQVLSSVPQQF